MASGHLEFHGHDRGRRRALPKRGQSPGEMTLGSGRPRPAPTPSGDPIIGALDTAFYNYGGPVDYSLSALGVPGIVGTYPPTENTDTFATQTYVDGGEPPGVPGWSGPSIYSAETLDGRAILRTPATGRVRLQARVPVKNDSFGGIADAGHRLFFQAVLNGHAFDGYSDSADATVVGLPGAWNYVFDKVLDDAIGQELFDASADGVGFPFSIIVYYWPNFVATDVRGIFPQKAIARPKWNVGPSPELGEAGNYVRLQYELDVYPTVTNVELSSGRIAFEGHDRGRYANPQSA